MAARRKKGDHGDGCTCEVCCWAAIGNVEIGPVAASEPDGYVPHMLTCVCCGAEYTRGEFSCCKPPRWMRWANWLKRHCTTCQRCPRHCGCQVEAPQYLEWPKLKVAIHEAANRIAMADPEAG